MKKRRWRRPRLIVVVRGMAGEMVLAACKLTSGGGYAADGGGCTFVYYHCHRCIDSTVS